MKQLLTGSSSKKSKAATASSQQNTLRSEKLVRERGVSATKESDIRSRYDDFNRGGTPAIDPIAAPELKVSAACTTSTFFTCQSSTLLPPTLQTKVVLILWEIEMINRGKNSVCHLEEVITVIVIVIY